MANISKTAAGTYRVFITRKGFARIHKTFSLKAEAELWAAETEAAMLRGAFVSMREAERTTIAEACARYRREITSTKRATTQRREGTMLARLAALPMAGKMLAALRGVDIAEWRDARLKVVSPRTVQLEMVTLSHVFTICRKEWGMEGLANPFEAVRGPTVKNERERRFEAGEEDRIRAHLSDEMNAILTIALETAMRRGEIHAARRDWIRGNVLRIPDDSAKTGARSVPLSSVARAAMAALPARLDGKLFALHVDTISKVFLRACRKAGVEGLHFHDMRHEATSRLFEKGLTVDEVRSITGHKSMSQLSRYTHHSAERLAAKLG